MAYPSNPSLPFLTVVQCKLFRSNITAIYLYAFVSYLIFLLHLITRIYLMQIKFVEGVVGTPQITDSVVLPENVEFLGQKIDLTPLKGLFNSVQDTASSVAKTISNQPPLKINISQISQNAESWLLTTYLDQELRISRGDAGSVFVFIKEGSSLLSPWTHLTSPNE